MDIPDAVPVAPAQVSRGTGNTMEDGTMIEYCPNCRHFREIVTDNLGGEHPPLGRLTPDMLEDQDGSVRYGCYCPSAWIHVMPIRVIDIQLLRAVKCGSFVVREEMRE
jgi:hypothetical protein